MNIALNIIQWNGIHLELPLEKDEVKCSQQDQETASWIEGSTILLNLYISLTSSPQTCHWHNTKNKGIIIINSNKKYIYMIYI